MSSETGARLWVNPALRFDVRRTAAEADNFGMVEPAFEQQPRLDPFKLGIERGDHLLDSIDERDMTGKPAGETVIHTDLELGHGPSILAGG